MLSHILVNLLFAHFLLLNCCAPFHLKDSFKCLLHFMGMYKEMYEVRSMGTR